MVYFNFLMLMLFFFFHFSLELNRSESDEEDEGDEDDDIFGEDELANLEEPQEELPTEYQRYMTWKI